MKHPDFDEVDQKIDYLIELCQKLEAENRQLRHQEQVWKNEKAKLMEKNDVARNKVETMINRLRTLEHES